MIEAAADAKKEGNALMSICFGGADSCDPDLANVASLPGLHFNAAAWADFDLDGDLDLLLSGDKGDPFTQLYRNDGGVFTAVPTTLPALVSSAAAWGD
jgi:hypothetical protein